METLAAFCLVKEKAVAGVYLLYKTDVLLDPQNAKLIQLERMPMR